LIRYPRLLRAGRTIDETVLNIDIAPTVLELSGTRAMEALHGRSLVPLLRGERASSSWRSSFLIEYYSDSIMPRIRGMGYAAVRGARYKYIRYGELTGMDELYDLRDDPYEMKNLVSDPARQPVLRQMQAELERLRDEAGP
jgi:N-acetylglucosamine-6-sulfatase